MRMILAGVGAAVLLGVLAAAVLGTEQRRAYEVFTTSGARVGIPGNNLVGADWSGNNREPDRGRPPTPR